MNEVETEEVDAECTYGLVNSCVSNENKNDNVQHKDTVEVMIDNVKYDLEVNAVDDKYDDNGMVANEGLDEEEIDVARIQDGFY